MYELTREHVMQLQKALSNDASGLERMIAHMFLTDLLEGKMNA